MSKTITYAHRKGGVGKTTCTANSATGMASLSIPVVAIDLDPQGNLGEFLGVGTAPDVFDLLMARDPSRDLARTLVPVPDYPYLRVIRGNDETKAAERALGDPQSSRTLTAALQAVIRAIYASTRPAPYIFIDTPPGLGALQLAALTVSDYLLIPVNPAYASETGLPKLAQEVQEIRNAGRGGVQLLGIIPTRYKPRTIEHQEVLNELARTFGRDKIWPAVRDTIRLEECPGRGVPIWRYDSQSTAAQDYAAVLIQLMRALGIPMPKPSGNGRPSNGNDRGEK